MRTRAQIAIQIGLEEWAHVYVHFGGYPTPAMTTRRATDNSEALDAFLTAKAELDAMLERLKALSDDHFETHLDEINWGHVGTVNYYASRFRQITDAAFKEGRHAA